MNKLTLVAAVLGLALTAHAAPAKATTTTTTTTTTTSAPSPLPLGLNAIGYDGHLDHVTARLGLSENNAVDLGVGLNMNTAAATDDFILGLSGFYLLKLQDWGMVDNYLVAGGWVNIFSDSDLGLTLFGGLQPEITLLDRIIVSFRFGVQAPILPDFGLQTVGSPISIVEGISFKIIW
jgi:hypothetical protein